MKFVLGILMAVALLWGALPALAQPRGELLYHDEVGRLDRAQVEAAAEPLLVQGAHLSIFLVEQGSRDDFERRMEQDRLKEPTGNNLLTTMLAVYISLNPPLSYIQHGSDWNTALSTEVGGRPNSDLIRESNLDPNKSLSDLTAAYVNTLRAIDAAATNPPEPAGGMIVRPESLLIGLGVLVVLVLISGTYVTTRVLRAQREQRGR